MTRKTQDTTVLRKTRPTVQKASFLTLLRCMSGESRCTWSWIAGIFVDSIN